MPPPTELENALRDLPNIGTIIKDRGYRQIWRFEVGGHAYFLKFYPRGGPRDRFRRWFRGSPAMSEFTRLQALQKANIPAARAAAVLMGFNLSGRRGDAVILHAIEPSTQVDQYLADYQLRGDRAPNHADLSKQIREIVKQLGVAKMGHDDLHLGNFLLSSGKIFLLDGYAVRRSGLRLSDVMHLGHSVGSFATRTDLLRGWRLLGPGTAMPRRNGLSRSLLRRDLGRITGDNRYFGHVRLGDWNGFFFKQTKFPKRWSTVSRTQFTAQDWQAAWPEFWRRIEADDFTIIKRSRSGDVLSGEFAIAGRSVGVIIKRPRRRYWYRYINEIGRGTRARREWKKAWHAIARDLPTAWPIAFFERRVAGYIVDSMILFERVPGPTLASIDLAAAPACDRDRIFRRTGRILRRIESFGFAHFDAKSSNWIVRPDDVTGPTPMLIDIDGIRFRRWRQLGIKRLLRSMKALPQFSAQDSLALREGYSPWSPAVVRKLGES